MSFKNALFYIFLFKVFMLNVRDDEVPVIEPSDPVMTIKESNFNGDIVHIIQAFDPDGSSVTFAFRSTSPLSLLFLYLALS